MFIQYLIITIIILIVILIIYYIKLNIEFYYKHLINKNKLAPAISSLVQAYECAINQTNCDVKTSNMFKQLFNDLDNNK